MQGPSDRFASFAALLVVAFVIGLTIRHNVFVPWGTDSAAYLAAAHRWAAADLFSPASFVFWAPWDPDGNVEAPLGHRPGPTKGSLVTVYPLGYPILLATALKIGGPLAMYVVAPVFAGLLAWCTFVLASELSTSWAGLVAAFLIAATPVTLSHAIMPMSDVPAAALWALSWVMSLRPGFGAAAAAGASTALAVMVRPNLAPIAAVIAAVTFASQQEWWRRLQHLLVYGVFASIGPLLVLWSQAVLYGHPLASGYPGTAGFFDLNRIPQNAWLYPRLVVELHTWLVFAGLLIVAAVVISARRSAAHFRIALIAVAACGIIAVNYALYLAYLTYEGWYWLRFMFPALTALFILFAATVDSIRLVLVRRLRPLGTLMVVPVLIVGLHPSDEMREQFPPLDHSIFPRLNLMGHYLREVLPARAVILTFLQSGAAALYTGLPIVRLDLVAPDALDRVISDLQRRHYCPVLMIDHAVDHEFFRQRFGESRYVRLDWPARAEFFSGFLVTYRDPADRELFFSGDRWPIDLLESPASPFVGSWSLVRVPLETIVFPPLQESWLFKEALERKYRDALSRSAMTTHVDPKTSVMWTRRYLRYRLHGCSHAASVSRVMMQIDGGGPQPLCVRPEEAVFPAWDDTVDFRRQLEVKYRDGVKPPSSTTFVDTVGDAVWNQEYLRYRTLNCTHDQAVQAVFNHIDGFRTTCSN